MPIEDVRYRRLHPEPADITADALLDSLDLGRRELPDRPYTLVNFISSADGRATFQGRSGGLGDDGDRAIFHGLRERVDAVMAGTVTMRTENYGRVLGKPERRARRAAAGRTSEPIACLLTRSGDVPAEIPLFAEPEAHVVIFAATDVDLGQPVAKVDLVCIDATELTLTTALRHLHADYGVQTLLCEGGPTLFGAMLHERLVDELFLTLAPKLTGGGHGPTISSGPELPELEPLELKWLLERDGSLYLRYALGAG